MNTYNVYYNGKEAEVTASTTYDAQLKAVELFKVSRAKRHMISVVLAAKAGVPVTLHPAQL